MSQTRASDPHAVEAAQQVALGPPSGSSSSSSSSSSTQRNRTTGTPATGTSTATTSTATITTRASVPNTSSAPETTGSNLQAGDMNSLLARIKILEEQNKPSVQSIIAKVNALAFTSEANFDKYNALALAQSLVYCTQDTGHKKAAYYAAALQEIRACMLKSTRDF
ncbi:hypothetical protein AC249_AIPGENE27546, partial [Exaiptasia diaphana]